MPFQRADKDQRAYFLANQEAVGLLEQITALEKGQAVPYIKIWQIEPGTGKPVNVAEDGVTPKAPLTLKSIEPPRFGATSDIQFRERPPVSLDRLSVKTNSFRGAITNQAVEISWTVHRPDVIFGDPIPGVDNWSTIITPGLMHVVEYGWQSSGQHPLLNGDGYMSTSGGKRISIPAKKRVVFTVIDYSFKITPDLQFKIVTHAVENGDLHLRTATLAGLFHPNEEANQQQRSSNHQVDTAQPIQINDKSVKQLFDDLQNRLKQVPRGRNIPGVGSVIKFQDFADKFFAPTLDRILTQQMGFKTVNLWMGNFNKRAGLTSKRFGSNNMSEASIGDFEVPLDWIQKQFQEVVKTGINLSVTNFVTMFTHLFQADEVWDRTSPALDKFGIENYTTPDVRVKTVMNGDTIDFYITDVKSEVVRFTESDREKGGENLTTDQIREKLKSSNIPYVKLLKANSFILDSNFDVVNDEQMKAILIKRYNAPTREQFVQEPTAQRRAAAPAPQQLIYSSAIVGQITMIGNFCFDTFAMIWLDFGVKNWNGTFFVNEHEDVLERGSFITSVSVQATGEDPLNTQGRIPLTTAH